MAAVIIANRRTEHRRLRCPLYGTVATVLSDRQSERITVLSDSSRQKSEFLFWSLIGFDIRPTSQ